MAIAKQTPLDRFDPGMNRDARPAVKRCRQGPVGDTAIRTCLTMKVRFEIDDRPCRRPVANDKAPDLNVPDCNTWCRRQKTFSVAGP